jgi:arginyl-tRNA synthetase
LRVRKELTAADISLYVVGSEQRLHLAQVIETATRMGYIAPGEAHHVVIGLLTKYGEKVSSRDGSSLALEGFLAFLEKEAATVIASRQPDMAIEEQRRLASQLARGALFFTFSQRNPDKGFEFDVQKIFALDGRSALYLQYAATRADSLLTKAGTANKEISALNWEEVCRLMPKAAEELVFEISRLPIAIENALQLRSPHPLADSGFRLAQRFNRFFNEVQVKGAEGDVGQFYRHLVKAFRQTLGNILTMINIEVPERI